MSDIAPAFVTVNPSMTLPGIILPYNQASDAFDLLPTGEPLVRLGEGDLMVYANRADIRTKAIAAQSSPNELPSVEIVLSQINTATYNQRVVAHYDHHDTAAMARRGMSIVQAQRLGMRQSHAQLAREALLYGYNPANGEGIVNAPGALQIMFPPDSNGNDTAIEYDNGQAGQFLMQQVGALKTRTMSLGYGNKFVFLMPQRIGALWEYNVVQVTQFQRPGAGTDSTKGTVQAVTMANGDTIIWGYDDTLIGKGAGGTDMIILGMPEVHKPTEQGINTNVFAEVAPGIEACLLQLCDMAAPREIPTPLAFGTIHVGSEMRLTSGWPMRPETLSLISIAFD
jgi:hypothetical protein